MKHILFYLSATLYLFLSAQAMENPNFVPLSPDSIPLSIVHKGWLEKIRLTINIIYQGKEEKDIFFILDRTAIKLPIRRERTNMQHTSIPYGKINEINLFLQTYHEECDDDDTLLAIFKFKPSFSLLKKIAFRITATKIWAVPNYNLPPKFEGNGEK